MTQLAKYAANVEGEVSTGTATEHSYRGAFKNLLDSLHTDVSAQNEPRRAAFGAPDFALSLSTAHGPRTVGHAEAKDLGADLNAIVVDSDKAKPTTVEGRQLRRYRANIPNLLFTNYLDLVLFKDGTTKVEASLGNRSGNSVVWAPVSEQSQGMDLLRLFVSATPEPIAGPHDLAQRMARLAQLISGMVSASLLSPAPGTAVLGLRQALTETLLPQLGDDEYADVLAQTLTYGIFASRITHPDPSTFDRSAALNGLPRQAPFLRRLFGYLAGSDFEDEPFIGFLDDVVDLLKDTDMAAIMSGMQDGSSDPMVHFYENFLSEYNPTLRNRRGVYYTPEPVVSFIVRSVEQVLTTTFNLTGLQDTTTVTSPDGLGQVPRLQILDPATGTGTFLAYIIRHVRQQFMDTGNKGLWVGFVKDHLLPRLFGFELMMAPYTIAHMKLGMVLAGDDLDPAVAPGWEYKFDPGERLGIYLTNALEPSPTAATVPMGTFIADEANAAGRIKSELPIMAIIGNPPYAGHSANASKHLETRGSRQREVRTWIGRLIADYTLVDGNPLKEHNKKWLQDDYVKFIRMAQWKICKTGSGVVGFIINHGFIDNPTFRGMRQSLLTDFSKIYILNLHGSVKKRERTPTGQTDEGVFDIESGTCICLFVRENDTHSQATVYYADLWGARKDKFDWLSAHTIDEKTWGSTTPPWQQIQPNSPNYWFIPTATTLLPEYRRGMSVTQIFPINGLGVLTKRDKLAIAESSTDLIAQLATFTSSSKSAEALADDYGIRSEDKDGWNIAATKSALAGRLLPGTCRPITYRPFDDRYYYDDDRLIARRNVRVNGPMFGGGNRALLIGRQGQATGSDAWDVAWATRHPADHNVFRRGGAAMFPLYLDPQATPQMSLGADGDAAPSNLSDAFIETFTTTTGLEHLPSGCGDLMSTWGPDDAFDYIYAILHSRAYRARYADQLSREFPRIPFTNDIDCLRELVKLGGELFSWHTALAAAPATTPGFPEGGSNTVAARHPIYAAVGMPSPVTGVPVPRGRVYINAEGDEGQYFEGVDEDVWEFTVGGGQVCQKWLRDRKKSVLTSSRLIAYQRLVGIVTQTLVQMEAIDNAISVWPPPWAGSDSEDT